MKQRFCNAFKDSSEFVYKWLKKQNSVGEESITDWLLYNLSEKLPELLYVKFTRHQEAKVTGADWEWWIVGDQSALHIRIQAKRIKYGVDNYPGLAHTNSYGLQIDKLLNDAMSKNYLPFYALYVAPATKQKVLCGGHPDDAHTQGVFIASAEKLNEQFIVNGRTRVEADEVLSYSNPLHCLACCPLSSYNDPDPFYRYIRHYFLEAIKPSGDTESDSGSGIHKEAPKYVMSLLRFKDDVVPECWEYEFKHQLNKVDNLVVLDLRGEER